MINAHDPDSSEILEVAGSSRAVTTGVTVDGRAPQLKDQSAVVKTATRKLAAFVVLFVIAVAGTAMYFSPQIFKVMDKSAAVSSVPPPAVTVSVTSARTEEVADTVSVTGSVMAWDPLTVGAEAGGMRITSVTVEEGDTVKKGQVLATLNAGVIKAQLVQARARLGSAEASVKKSIQPNRPEEINALNEMLVQNAAEIRQQESLAKEAHINYEAASVNSNRWSFMAKNGAVSRFDADTKKAAASVANEEVSSTGAKLAALRSVRAQTLEKLNMARNGGRSEDVEISRAAVEEAKGQIEQLERQIEQTIIRAPDDGVVARRDAHLGDITGAGTPLFSLIRLNRLELRAQVSDIDLAKFKTGQLVRIAVREDDDGKIVGRVSLVSPQVEQASRLGTVRISLPANAGLKPGMFVRGQVDMGRHTAITVPATSVISRNGESFVFTLSSDKAVSVPVRVGVTTDKIAEILSGVSSGELIVDSGARFLTDRDIVRVEK